MKKITYFGVLMSIAAVPSAAVGADVSLQEGAEVSSQDGAEENSNGDIVVTARFKSESLQSVPVAVSAISGSAIENTFAADITVIEKMAPNVNLNKLAAGAGSLGATIRGIGNNGVEKTAEPTVGVSIDGVFLGTSAGASLETFDIASIEVLRGPQGTLYGRNTIGGNIVVRRSEPTGKFGVKAFMRLSRYDNRELGAVVNLPTIGDLLAVKLYGFRRKGDGFTYNVTLDQREKGADYWAVGAALLLDAGGPAKAKLTLDWFDDQSQYPNFLSFTAPNSLEKVNTFCESTPVTCDTSNGLLSQASGYRNVYATSAMINTIKGQAGTLEVNWDIGDDLRLTSISGLRSHKEYASFDNVGSRPVGATGTPLLSVERRQRYRQASEEVRLSKDGGPLSFIIGGMLFSSKYELEPGSRNGLIGNVFLFGSVPVSRYSAEQSLLSVSTFGEAVWSFAPQLRLTAGARYTWERKKFRMDNVVGKFTCPGSPVCPSTTESWNPLTGRVIVDWSPSDNAMLYAGWSRGFRSGGYNGRAARAEEIGPYEAETVDSFEAGARLEFLDGVVRFNPTAFFAKYKNKQENVYRQLPAGDIATVTANAADASTRGVEVEAVLQPSRDFTIRATYGFVDAHYDNFMLRDPNTGLMLDLAGFGLPHAPHHNFGAAVEYGFDALGGHISLGSQFAHRSSFKNDFRSPTGTTRDYNVFPGRSTLDFRVSYQRQVGKTEIELIGFVKDVTHWGDAGYRLAQANGGSVVFAALDIARTQGIELRVKY